MSIEIAYHIPLGGDSRLDVWATDEPEYSAHHEYEITWPSGNRPIKQILTLTINFQKSPIAEVGMNGITNEALLAIVQHRLECFQAGPFACEENAAALVDIEAAMGYLHARTADRQARGVEGKYEK